MLKPIVTAILVLVLLPPALCSIDVSPYENLASEISSKETALEAARAAENWDEVITILNQLESLQSQLSSSQMTFLRMYSVLKLAFDESNYLVSKTDLLPAGSTSPALDQFDNLKTLFLLAESSYDSGNYSDALTKLKTIKNALASTPESLAFALAQGASDLKNQMQSTSTVTPSALAMLDNAKEKFMSAKDVYIKAAKSITALEKENSQNFLESGHASASDGFDLIVRAKSEKGEDFDSIKYVLVLAPITLIIGLLAYFNLVFKKSSLKCYVSKTTIPASSEDKLERRIDISNPLKSKTLISVTDNPPKELHPFDFSHDPVIQPSGELIWNIYLESGEKTSITYKLESEVMAKGKKIIFPTARLVYSTEFGDNKIFDRSFEIEVV